MAITLEIDAQKQEEANHRTIDFDYSYLDNIIASKSKSNHGEFVSLREGDGRQ
jgi:hypothetical protein